MLDHVYGKPSTTWKRIETIAVTLASLKLIKRYHNRAPPGGKLVRRLNDQLKSFAPWQIVCGTLTAGYLFSKMTLMLSMNSPEPYARYYSKNYYRATWILVALDAGFWTAMNIKIKPIRDICSILFTLIYLVFADMADYKVRRLRATPTLDMMRLSWEKQKHPLLSALSRALQPRVTWRGREIKIPRRATAFGYNSADPKSTYTIVNLYFAGKVDDLDKIRQIIFHIPGGGFVCMSPQCHEDYLVQWAVMSPYTLIVAVDYGKAPEYPYPYAIEECFDLYRLVRETNGECLGLGGWDQEVTVRTMVNGEWTTKATRTKRPPLKITLSGDSAGGSLATAVTIRCIETNVPGPTALILIYPFLNLELSCWLSTQQTQLLRVESAKNINSFLDSKHSISQQQLALRPASPLSVAMTPSSVVGPNTVPNTPASQAKSPALSATSPAPPGHQRTRSADGLLIEDEDSPNIKRGPSFFQLASRKLQVLRTQKPHTIFDDYSNTEYTASPYAQRPHAYSGHPTQLTMTSHMSYFNDRVLTPEIMRALALLYIGPSTVQIDMANDYHLSCLLCPESILVKFPKTYFLCGEKDPLVDHTVIFAGKLREAKQRAWARKAAKTGGSRESPLRETDIAEVAILEGQSHAFLQMMAFLPEATEAARLLHSWFMEAFAQADLLVDSLAPGSTLSSPTKLNVSPTATKAPAQATSPDSSKSSKKTTFMIGGKQRSTSPDTSQSDYEGVTTDSERGDDDDEEQVISVKSTHSTPSSVANEQDPRKLLESRDNAHVDQNLLLARRSMHISHGLYDDKSKAKPKPPATGTNK